MIFINRPETDPYFNIAAEEHILKNTKEDVVMLWQCNPCVVIGKHQNTHAEVNVDLTRKQHIPVIRRISGGGTVYHDLGNINYTVISSEERRDKLIDFVKFTRPIIDFLSGYGLDVRFEGKNNLVVGGKKFSGNSAHVFKNRVLHHGTLLFNTDIEKLDELIHPKELDIQDKAVKSIRATVTNISDHLGAEIGIPVFKEKLQIHLCKHHQISRIGMLSEVDKSAIQKRAEEKYKLWQWNFGYSPSFVLRNKIGGLSIEIKVKNGAIEFLEIVGQSDSKIDVDSFYGIHYREQDVKEVLLKEALTDKDLRTYLKLLGF